MAASSTQTARPGFSAASPSSHTTTPGPWATPCNAPAVVRYARTREFCKTTVGCGACSAGQRERDHDEFHGVLLLKGDITPANETRYALSSIMDYPRLGTDRAQNFASRSWLRKLRRHRFGARIFRDGRKRGGGLCADGPCVRRGINFFDTANAYGGGRSETFIGNWLHDKGPAVRQQLLLSSKVFNPVGQGPNDRGLSRRHILQQVDASLSRLRTDRLDMYLIHEPDPKRRSTRHSPRWTTWFVPAKSLRRRQQHRSVAAGARALDQRRAPPVRFEWVQNSVQPARPGRRTRAVSSLRRSGRRIHGLQPTCGRMADRKISDAGSLSAGSRMTLRPEPYLHLISDHIFRGLTRLRQKRPAAGVDMTALALAWVLHQPRVDAAIIGRARPRISIARCIILRHAVGDGCCTHRSDFLRAL